VVAAMARLSAAVEAAEDHPQARGKVDGGQQAPEPERDDASVAELAVVPGSAVQDDLDGNSVE